MCAKPCKTFEKTMKITYKSPWNIMSGDNLIIH